MANEIDGAVKQTQRYRYEDGLIELATGMLFLGGGLGLFSWLAFTEVSNALGITLIVLLAVLVVGGGLFIKRAVEEMKLRITYPRTGYVAYKEQEKDSGKVPEWVKVMAHRPEILKEFTELFKTIMNEGKIESFLKWKIALVVLGLVFGLNFQLPFQPVKEARTFNTWVVIRIFYIIFKILNIPVRTVVLCKIIPVRTSFYHICNSSICI